jgi:hypothetical protein
MASIAVKAEMQHLPPFMQKRIKVAKFIKQTPRDDLKKNSIIQNQKAHQQP